MENFMNAIDQRLNELGLILPEPVAPVANYVPYVTSGNLVFISGQVSVDANGIFIKGRLGDGLDLAEGQTAAKLCALNLIAQMKAACDGDLTRVKRIVKVGGFVCAKPIDTGAEIPKIINGCSDLLVDVFGDKGRHARFAVSTPSLPLDCAVEIDAVVEIEN
jgi:enamine deaminase RidA (YjgF/YER057c/UK114 family)